MLPKSGGDWICAHDEKSAPKPRPRQSLWTAKHPRIAMGTQSSRGALYDDQSTSLPDAVTATIAETMA